VSTISLRAQKEKSNSGLNLEIDLVFLTFSGNSMSGRNGG